MIERINQFRNLVEALAAAPPDRPFITHWIDEDERETVTFGEFYRRAWAQANALRERDVAKGDRLVIVMPQGIPAMAVFVGAMMLGSIPAFLAYPNFKIDPAKYRSGLMGVTQNLGAKAVVIDDDFDEEMLSYVSLAAGGSLLRAARPDAGNDELTVTTLEHSPESVAFIQHSAGTTGLQKGVALTHAAVLRQLVDLAQTLKIDSASDCVYSWLPLYHDMGLIACFMLPMAFHLPVIMQSPLDWVMRPETMLQIITEYKCTLSWMPNFAFQFVPRRAPPSRWPQYDLSSLRALINCSEPVRSSSMQEFKNAFSAIGLKGNVLQSSYAMAENVFAVTQSNLSRGTGPLRLFADSLHFRAKGVIVPLQEGDVGCEPFQSSGELLPNHQVRIVSDTGDSLPPGQVGEILIKSDSLFEGYFNRPDLTAQAMQEGWYRSGDLGFLWQDELFVVGRKKDLLIVGGENLYPQDIEENVGGHAAIHDGRVVALGMYNPELGTDDIVVVAEVESLGLLANSDAIEREVRNLVVAGTGVAVRSIFLKPPKWIVKSTAGKAARSATREKLLAEHPELKAGTEA